MKIWLIIVVLHTTKVVVKKNSGPNRGFEPKLCLWSFKYSLELIIIYYPGCQRSFSRWKGQNWAAKPSREAARKKYYELTKWPALRWLDSSVGRGLHRYRTGQNIAPIKVPFFAGLPYKACDMSLRDIQTMHVSNMLARDSISNFARFGH